MSIDEKLLQKFDEAKNKKGYTTRSSAFCEAIRNFVDDIFLPETFNTAILMLIYDGQKIHKRELFELQHRYKEIRTVLHVHIDDINCLEIFIVKGDSETIGELVKMLRKLSGIKQLKYMTTISNI